jgi:hypothetical protein
MPACRCPTCCVPASPPVFAELDNPDLESLCSDLLTLPCLKPETAVGAASYRDGHVARGVALGLALGVRGNPPPPPPTPPISSPPYL